MRQERRRALLILPVLARSIEASRAEARVHVRLDDEFAVPLCRIHHRELHDRGDEKSWWEGFSIDPNLIAEHLWSETR
jgi:hypothetical protein